MQPAVGDGGGLAAVAARNAFRIRYAHTALYAFIYEYACVILRRLYGDYIYIYVMTRGVCVVS